MIGLLLDARHMIRDHEGKKSQSPVLMYTTEKASEPEMIGMLESLDWQFKATTIKMLRI